MINQHPAIPMMMHFGVNDHAIPLDDVNKISEAWPDVTVHLYEAEHGFNCDARASFSAVPAAIAQAWDEEIARRVADMDAGKTVWIPAEEVFARLDALIENAR